MHRQYRKDLLFLLLWPVLAGVISLAFHVTFLTSILLFFGVPALFLTIRGRVYAKKAAIFSLAIIPLGIAIDYIAHITRTWQVTTLFPFRILGIVPVEDVLFGFLNVYFILMFYEHFLDQHVPDCVVEPQMKYGAAIGAALVFSFIAVFLLAPSLLNIPYFYLLFGLLLIAPPVLFEVVEYPVVFAKIAKAASYFFLLSLVYELVALRLNLWSFPGAQFVGKISAFGIAFPIEELVFWMVLFAMAVLTYFEFWDDDER